MIPYNLFTEYVNTVRHGLEQKRREIHNQIYTFVGQKYSGFSSDMIDKFNRELEKAVAEQLEEPKEKEGYRRGKCGCGLITDEKDLCPCCGKYPENCPPKQAKLIEETTKEEKGKPTLDLNKYGIEKWGKIGQFDIYIVDGIKIKNELDSNWCGPEESGCYIAGHPKVQLFTFAVPDNTIIVSTERKTEKDIIASVSHEFVEFHLMKNGMKYEEADPISRDVEDLIVRLYENNFIQKSPWMTMMEELSTPEHFKQQSRRFPMHKEEEEKSVETGLASVAELIKQLTNMKADESDEPEERSRHDLETGEAYNGGIGF